MQRNERHNCRACSNHDLVSVAAIILACNRDSSLFFSVFSV